MDSARIGPNRRVGQLDRFHQYTLIQQFEFLGLALKAELLSNLLVHSSWIRTRVNQKIQAL